MRLFLSRGCAACHRINGVFNASEQAPDLTRIALSRSREAIDRILIDPRVDSPSSPMPAMAGPDADRNTLIAFLLAQIGPERERGCSAACVQLSVSARPSVVAHFSDDLPQKPNPALGALWARRVGCGGCHRLAADEPGVPDLTRVAWFRAETHLRRVLRDPREVMPNTWMPAFGLPEPLVESMVQWLNLQKAPLPSTPKDVFQAVCRRCHGRDRDSRVVVLSRLPPMLEGRIASIARERFVDMATKGVEGTAMAPWGRLVSPAFLGAIYDSLQ
jgi:mono/diheme cytochrome c family protein